LELAKSRRSEQICPLGEGDCRRWPEINEDPLPQKNAASPLKKGDKGKSDVSS
jgi:hypothetical protein